MATPAHMLGRKPSPGYARGRYDREIRPIHILIVLLSTRPPASFAPQPLLTFLKEITFQQTARGSHNPSGVFFPWSHITFQREFEPVDSLQIAPLASDA
jgi:hypothetical protein